MADYVAFLRAINLGKNRKFPMAELRSCLEAAGFEGPETYIQTGNVRVRSPLRSHARLAERLEELFEADRGFAVPTVVMTAKELRSVYDDAMGIEPPSAAHADGLRRYVTLLKDAPDASDRGRGRGALHRRRGRLGARPRGAPVAAQRLPERPAQQRPRREAAWAWPRRATSR